MPYDRTDRIRRAAILVASLDDALAERILAGFPPAVRDRVLRAAENLEAIDVEEQQDVLAEFRRMTRSRGGDAGVEFAPTANDQPSGESSGNETAALTSAPDATATESTLSDADAAAMAELLAREHPQIAAAALSRLRDDESAAVFAALPPALQGEALERLASLAPVDEEAVQEVASQLQTRLQARRELQARSAAGAQLVQKILARIPAAQRSSLLARLSKNDVKPAVAMEEKQPALGLSPAPASMPAASRASTAAAVDPVAQQAKNLALAVRRARAAGALVEPPLDDCSEELAQISDQALVAALQRAGETTVLRALAASGEEFLERVAGMLPRRQARKLRGLLRRMGPARLVDLHAAQHELLRLAHQTMPLAA
jgi:flagellar motor switch protein FliG